MISDGKGPDQKTIVSYLNLWREDGAGCALSKNDDFEIIILRHSLS